MRRTDEIDSTEELAVHIESGHSLGAAVVQGVDLGEVDADWERLDVAGAFFLGCRIADPEVAVTL
ncbi:MAG TPA: hypothetical protein VHI96_09525, partial [Solirubrobacterales bacterium]|nr:hypothetical protein [Solirubrobacterales bacterium]